MSENNNQSQTKATQSQTQGTKIPLGKTKVGAVLDVTVDKMRAMADSSTIIGDQISVGDGTVVIPISKVAYGFASGGTDFASKNPSPNGGLFAGGGGGGMTVTPIAFIVINNGDVKLMSIPIADSIGPVERAVAMAPDLIDKLKDLFGKKNKNPDEAQAEAEN